MNQADDGKCSLSIADTQVAQMHFDWAAFTQCRVNLKAEGKKKSALFFLKMAMDPGGLEGP